MARQGETAALDDQLRYRVDNLTVLVRQAALEAVREALGREAGAAPRTDPRRSQPAREPRRKRTQVVELVPATEPEPSLDDTQRRDAVVEQLAAYPDLLEADLSAALDAEPRHVKRALTALIVEERVVASGEERGMRYRVVGEEPVVELVLQAPLKAGPVTVKGQVSSGIREDDGPILRPLLTPAKLGPGGDE